MLEDTKYWVAWNQVPGIGRVRLGFLRERFGSLREAWSATSGALLAAGLDSRSVAAFSSLRTEISPDGELEKMEKAGVQAITLEDPAYPDRLKEIYDPPAVLYVLGNLLPDDAWSITVVGTRTLTAYGREVCARLVRDLARNRVTIVSGLARGIDAVAHQTALDSGARTLAVMACGLDMVYPPGHASLARRIAENGAVMSDYPIGTRPRSEYFPRRNRILAGLTLGTLVIEAGEQSGALITAKFANDEGREVMAVPGSILSPQSKGSNRLVQDGAKAVLDVEDILEEDNVRPPVQRQLEMPGLADLSPEEALLMKHLSAEPLHVDDLRRAAGLTIAEVTSTLAVMELKGLARQAGAMSYVASVGPAA
jgi:DNA processing protein